MEFSIIFIIIFIVILGLATNYIIRSGTYGNKLKRINQLYSENNYDLAMREINELDPKYKRDPYILWLSANLYYRQQQFILAMAALQNIIDAGSFTKEVNQLNVREFLAKIYEETGNYKKAIDEYDEIIRLKDQDFDSLYKAGTISYEAAEWSLAQKYFTLAVARNDSNPQLLYMLANCYYQMRSYHAAQQNIQRALDLDPNNIQYHLLYSLNS